MDFSNFVESGRLPLAVPSVVRNVCITADILYLIDAAVWMAAWRRDLLLEAAAAANDSENGKGPAEVKSATVAPAPQAGDYVGA